MSEPNSGFDPEGSAWGTAPAEPAAPTAPALQAAPATPAAPAAPAAPTRPTPGPRGVRLAALLVVASTLGAVLGGGGTYIALRNSGAFDTQPVVRTTTGTNARITVESESSAVIDAVKNVGPAVVTIVATEVNGQAVGSGIVYDAAGWIVTNKHVISGSTSISVRLRDGRTFKGTVYGTDTLTDLAIVKISGATNLTVAPRGDSSKLQAGEMAIAIGSPLGLDYPNTATEGIVSALGRDISVASDTGGGSNNLHGLIQTDAAINPGNSGGPLVNAAGLVIGIDTATEATAQGIGFAIPIDIAKPIMQQALAGKPLSRPYIGVSYIAINPGLAAQNQLPLNQGAWVHAEDATGNTTDPIRSGSPAQTAGLKSGDIITKIEGQAVDATHRLEDLLVQYQPGRTISLEIYRGGKYVTLPVTLGTRPTPTN